MKRLYVTEIYPTVQGEGPHTGHRQVFLRLAGCPLRCDYCDTPGSLTVNGTPPRAVDDVAREVVNLCRRESIETVSVTGGEPLAQADALRDCLILLRKSDLKIYLETAGVHPRSFARISDVVDTVAMDIKLPSATGRAYWAEHREFLSRSMSPVFIKVVVAGNSNKEEVAKAVAVAGRISPPPLLIFQPASPGPHGVQPPNPGFLSECLQMAAEVLPEVRIMSQMHKQWGIR